MLLVTAPLAWRRARGFDLTQTDCTHETDGTTPFPPTTNRTRFVRCVENLKAIMMLLREGTSPITQYEAFCIFRIFVVNPHIPHVVRRVRCG